MKVYVCVYSFNMYSVQVAVSKICNKDIIHIIHLCRLKDVLYKHEAALKGGHKTGFLRSLRKSVQAI